MKRFGFVLALLVLFSSMVVNTGTVSATDGFVSNVSDVIYLNAYVEMTARTTANDTSETDITATAQNLIEGLDSNIKVVYWIENKVVHIKATLTANTNVAVLLRLFGPVELKNNAQYSKTAMEMLLSAVGVDYDESTVNYDSNLVSGRVRVYAAVASGTNVYVTFTGSESFLKGFNYLDSGDHKNKVLVDGTSIGIPNWYHVSNGTHEIKIYAHDRFGDPCKLGLLYIGSDEGFTGAASYAEGSYEVSNYVIEVGKHNVYFDFNDALTGSALSGVTVKENGAVLGTIDDGGSLELTKGTHTLTFEKSGYWSVTKTVDVQSDMSVSVEMYPDSAAFKLENFPSSITIPENTIYELTFTLSPIDTSATYNTYLSISGLSNVLEVRKDGSLVSPENGKYYLGDISSDTSISIKFKAGAVGQHGFTLTLTSNDAIMSKTYTTTKQVTYQVEPLPFSVQMPSEWQVGENSLRISESSGQSYLITAVLKDRQDNEVWSESYAFSPYEAYSFSINIPSEGSYTLELQFNGQTAVYSVQVNPAITLVTKTITVSEGGEGVIVLHFKNPSSSVQYYTIKVSGGFLPAEINQSISVAPLSEKDVSIAFAVPEDLTYDAYELNVAVYQGNATVFNDKVAVSIGDSGGFTLFGGDSSTSWWVYALLGLFVVGGAIFVLRRR